jgi:hypothetical protein
MGARHWKTLLAAITASVALAAPAGAQVSGSRAFDRGYREGVQQGEQDARGGRAFGIESNRVYRDGDRGYDNRDGSRDWYRTEFRRGFSSGYRESFDRIRVNVQVGGRDDRYYGRDDRRDDRYGGPRSARGYQEPAFARGYSDGWEQGVNDGRDRDRYDPANHRQYRNADYGYDRGYGSKDAYKNNYRSGFRQGYEDGYRDGNRRRR